MVKFTSEMDEMYDIVLALLLPLLDENGSQSYKLEFLLKFSNSR